MDFRGFDSSVILNLRGIILMSIGDFPEGLSQAMLVGTMLVGRLGVHEVSQRPECLMISSCSSCAWAFLKMSKACVACDTFKILVSCLRWTQGGGSGG